MNSDKTDQYIRDQIQSLDRVKVPETSWTPQKSWDQIKPGQNKKAVILWWSSGSVAAAIIILLGYFWLIPQFVMQSTPVAKTEAVIQNFATSKTPFEQKPLEEIRMADGKSAEIPASEGNIKQIEENMVKRNETLITPEFLHPSYETVLLAKHEISVYTPSIRHMQYSDEADDNEKIAFNRVYVFKKNSGIKMPVEQTKPELAIRIDLTMKSSNEPPGGILAGLR